ncbi:MAG TPA: SDR family NAD(P)-dependent oxidoreductase, partial [Kofleriaceae bacterium]|nr:SDR family NAD(P)-dependent oxidoreductase [Kofleriaceae bacterium]
SETAAPDAGDGLRGCISLVPRWEPSTPKANGAWPEADARVLWVNPAPAQLDPPSLVLAVDDDPSVETIAARLRSLGEIDHVVWRAPASVAAIADPALIEAQAAGVIGLYRLIKALLALGYSTRTLGLTVLTLQAQAVRPEDRVCAAHASIHGLVGSLAKEQPRWKIRLVDLGREADAPAATWHSLPSDPRGRAWAHRDGVWHQQQLVPVLAPSTQSPAYRQRGVYVVIGGAGHIGMAWSEWVISRYQAQVIWLGRRPQDAAIAASLDRLAALGRAPHYKVADAADHDSLRNAYREIKQAHGRIDGVVLSSAVLEPRAIQDLPEEQLRASLRAKVDVSVRVAQVFADEPLDFVLFFSSLISFIKNPLQSHYAAGCSFVDAFAQQWARERTSPAKVINWGYWNKVGISGLEEVEQLTRAGIGMIETPEGMETLDALMSRPLAQVGLIKLTKPLAIEGLNADEAIRVLPEGQPVDAARLEARMQAALAGRHADIARRVAAQATSAGQLERLEELLAKLLLVQLRKLGLFQVTSTSLEAEKRRLDARYGRWLEETVRALGRRGYLRTDRAGLSVTRWPDEPTAWQEWEAAKPAFAADADLCSQVQLLSGTLPALPDILSGKRPATDVLFQGASMKQVESIYQGNARADYFNAVVAEAVVAYLEDRRGSASRPAPIRILEIGAGTGGTSAAVFERLRAYRDLVGEYCYTDLSKAFLLHAESQYGANNPYLTCKLFDVERALGGQGIEVGAYDLVIATNVLHATRRIRHTVRNAKAALRRHGLLLLNEMNSHSSGLFIHLTFGLTTGWWLFEDEALRIPGTPGLSPETWRSVLASEGFSGIQFPARAGHELGQQVVIAQSDGVVQQRVTQTNAVVTEPPAASSVAASAAPPAKPDGGGHAGAIADGLEDRVREAVLEVLCSSLKLQRGKVDVAASFADYGMDSIVGVGFVEALNRRLAIDLETTIIFDYSSVTRLSELIVSRHRDALTVKRPAHVPAKLEAPPPPPPSVASAEVRTEHAAVESSAQPLGREPIAIVGIAGRFARSSTPEELWQHLANGDDLVGEAQRWDLRSLYAELGRPDGCRYGSFLERLDEFDPLFFNISGMEATFMDPQQRIFLEEAWKALEDAGYAGAAVEGRSCGVYVGCMTGDYAEHCKRQAPAQAMWGNAASIIPARISYYLNLQGPAIAIDSACSSSLVAMHLACQALWAGEIELALAGGVSVQTTPGFYLQASNAGMLSSTGRCHTFDDRADGFVPGEGAGVVVLKRLSDALAAGDHIYGVIRGSGINQDGTTNGITAPSALSQERVERDVYASFGIHPEDIQMVEAHGTGTRLGDPIEFRALRHSFGASTSKKGYCALGSIKTNIGHTLLAAGVAGVLKLVMALKHRQLPPSLHFERGNSQIDFENSPFFVNTTLRPWDVEPGKKRCAAVSSFGFSGTNAHMVIEEAPAHARVHAIRPAYLVVLSARTAAQLEQQVTRLVHHCEEHRGIDCGALSYTLLLGRRHLPHRLACVARDVESLVTALRTWLDNGKAAQVFAAVLDDDREEQALLKQYGNQCIEECHAGTADARYLEHLSTLASLYTQGYRLSYERLFAGDQYARISLPTYPFAKDRYWPDESHRAPQPAGATTARPNALHPLLHRNTSTLVEQRFSTRFGTRFGGDEFFLDQHIVKGHKVLPGVAYVEMARAAVVASLDGGLQGSVVLQNIVWLRPVIGNGDTEVHIRLRSDADGAIDFEVYSGAHEDETAGLHAQGRAIVVDAGAVSPVELSTLRSRCTRSIEIDTCYATFHAMGIDHGPAYRGLTSVRVGAESEDRRFVLARVELPACVAETASQYVLHPSVMDSVLQSAVGLLLTGRADLTRPMLPFGLDRLEILHPCPRAAWVYIRPSAAHGQTPVAEGVEKVDIDVLDDAGAVCLRMTGFTSRVLTQELDADNTLLLMPRWLDRPLVQHGMNEVERTVLLDARYQARLA